ncbi:glycosyltransferase family 4 protein [Marinomonas sp. 5E14-1]|uniref:glycosyltransferase family 4 protein n=1 Tax=Marinomonas sp. 5E14-1 TaxID=3153922 RepID=UPI003267556F
MASKRKTGGVGFDMLKKILVLSEGYPNPQKIYNMSFVHSRNIEYLKKNIEVDVISFSSKEDYVFEGVTVFTKRREINFDEYDVILSHAPNIRNHYKFLTKNYKRIKSIILFFHGHEILLTEDYYPSPYSWQNNTSWISRVLRKKYDQFKLLLIRELLRRNKVSCIFVSEWMLEEGFKNLKIKNRTEISSKIINNSINHAFYNNRYICDPSYKKADFITIRPLDGRKYAVDKVVELASYNPSFTFHIFGKGELFKHIAKPDNVTVFDTFIEQKDIPELLNHYSAAVMPTRLDAQGVMMCEMASYGVPIIVSDLPVCREMLEGFPNCIFIGNDDFSQMKLDQLSLSPLTNFNVIDKFSPEVLAKKELAFMSISVSSKKQN